jgi:glyoxylase-like metal-dependent hydrolase (beta-lactamase superfamily II)
VGSRRPVAIVCTHAHDDHISAAQALARSSGAPVLLHPADERLWRLTYRDWRWNRDLADGDVLPVAGEELHVLHTPGHTPGAVCLYAPSLGAVFTGDTLFQGGPGATGRSFSDRPTILTSIRDRLLALGDATVVHTGHGADTTIGAERPGIEAALTS